tara:strand:+ start:919 stop:1452 length:534 start_codon:yes stop_codon:yes gene_type:complete
MPEITKHIGKIKDSGTRVAIAYRQLPMDKNSALVVPTNSLPQIYHDAFIQVIDSPEGQEANELQEILNRRTFPDGNNMLQALHLNGHLVKVATDQVLVMPRPGITIQLNDLNKEIKKIDGDTTVQPTGENDATKLEAKNLLGQAETMEQQAKTVRENAYNLDPNLRPKRGRPSKKAE